MRAFQRYNTNEENVRSSEFLLFFLTLFCLVCNMVPENWHICVNKGLTCLLTKTHSLFLIISRTLVLPTWAKFAWAAKPSNEVGTFEINTN